MLGSDEVIIMIQLRYLGYLDWLLFKLDLSAIMTG